MRTLLDEVANTVMPCNPLCGHPDHGTACLRVVDCDFGVLPVDLALYSLVVVEKQRGATLCHT